MAPDRPLPPVPPATPSAGAATPRVVAYLTSSYARATDTFIRDEVAELRAAGDTVVTFSVRKPDESEAAHPAVAAERARTTYLLDLPPQAFLSAVVRVLVTRPARFRAAVAVARRLARPGLKGRLWPWFYLVEAAALAERLRRDRVEHLHNHIAEGTASVALLASILADVPYSLTVHGPSEWDIPHELALDVKVQHAAFVAAITEHTRGQVRRWISQDDWAKVHVVHCGVRPDAVPDAVPVAGDRVVLVSVGRLAQVKGHLVLLQSLAALSPAERARLRVVLVGDGPERDRLTRYLGDHGLAETVELAGWQTSEEVLGTLAASSALVMPSFAEGLPVSIMEAYLMGKPVLSSAVGGIAELVEPGRSGWLVAPGAVPELTRALQELLALTPADLDRLGEHGRRRVLADHDLATEVARLRGLIHASAAAGRAGTGTGTGTGRR